MEKVFSKVGYPIGTIIFDEATNEAFEVKEVYSMFVMTGGEKTGFGLVLEKKEVIQ